MRSIIDNIALIAKWMIRKMLECFRKYVGRVNVRSRQELHAYWRNPNDGANRPEDYLKPIERSSFVLRLMAPYIKPTAHILEIGRNVGRNLSFLWDAGFRHLSGIQINPEVLAILRQEFPEMASAIQLWNAPVEDVIRDIPMGKVDVTFTIATLEHTHPDSEWVLDKF